MGDFRASVKIQWECVGIKKECDMWINYSRQSHIDERVEAFLLDAWRCSINELENRVAEDSYIQDRAARRKLYEKLKEEFE